MADADRDLQAAIAVTRFGLGARPGELGMVRADPRAWLKDQIRHEGADEPQGAAGPLPSMRDSFAVFARYQSAVQQQRRADTADAPPAQMTPAAMAAGAEPADPQAARRLAVQPILQDVAQEMLGRVRLGATTPAGFRERWALFWANHFTVAAKSIQTSVAVGPFEREAVRPNVFGRFEDLLAIASRHPGMLLYLDQAQSAGPDSQAGRNRKLGLNENLAREILELHTVGADAGYTQADVTEFARALTGWSLGGANAGAQLGAYIYRAAMHEPGERQVMGRTYRAGGDDQAGAILTDLAAHPATARRLAHKLAVHFVADDPPPALTARIEAAWTRSRGDLAAVARALIDAPEAWAPAPAKLKTPYVFLVSSYRAADASPRAVAQEVVQPLTTLGQRPFSAPQPNGWSDQASDWAAPDALVKRLTWARAFAQRYAPQGGAPADAARAALGARLSARTAEAVGRAESRPEAFALLLMSPEFQRR
jgi:uncharacterized protein (DUF1800 family)